MKQEVLKKAVKLNQRLEKLKEAEEKVTQSKRITLSCYMLSGPHNTEHIVDLDDNEHKQVIEMIQNSIKTIEDEIEKL